MYMLSDREGKVSADGMKGRDELVYPWGQVEFSMSFVPLSALQPPEAGLLVVKLYACMDLVAADSDGFSDSFITLTLGTSDAAQKSRVMQKQRDPIWGGDEFRFNVSKEGEPSDWRLNLVAMDHDKIGFNDSMGSLEVDLGPATKWKKDCGKKIYSLRDREGKVTDGMTGRDEIEYPWGRVELSLSFISLSVLRPPEPGMLIVKLYQCMDLVAADSNGFSDAYVRFELGAADAQKSRVHEKERDPVWGGDEFRFNVDTLGDASNWRLRVTALDYDLIGFNDPLGSLEVDLGPATKWKKDCAKTVYALRDRDGNVPTGAMKGRDGLEHQWGRVEFSLSFIPSSLLKPSGSGLLTVTLIKGSNFLAADRNGFSDPFVVFTLGSSPAQKSRVMKKTVDPAWNGPEDDFMWTVTGVQSCADWSLHVNVFDHDRMGSSESLGHFTLDIGMVLGKGWLGRANRRKGGGEVHGDYELRDDGKVPRSALKRRADEQMEALGLGAVELHISYRIQG